MSVQEKDKKINNTNKNGIKLIEDINRIYAYTDILKYLPQRNLLDVLKYSRKWQKNLT